MVPFTPQRKFLSLVSTGDQYAVASRGPWSAQGAWVWKLKDWIDRRWMAQYQQLPAMPMPARRASPVADPAALMRCGGCGAKIGSYVLSRVLARITPFSRPDVAIGLEAPDDAAVCSLPAREVTVQTIDHFRAFITDPYLFGRITAVHALGDIFAMGAQPQSALAVVTLPPGKPGIVEEQLFQLMSGANEVLSEHETTLAGGHTAEGPELSFGLSIQGFAKPRQLLRKSGVRPGDRLILTKPLGTGTLLAADMQGKSRGAWITAALLHMQRSNRDAALVLSEHKPSACTDVTGFGLIGHLHELMKASRVDATLYLDQIPALDGALETLAAGVFSTLHPENFRLSGLFEEPVPPPQQARYQLLFDPQTAGGLLAGVPPSRAAACLAALRQNGCPQAAIVGQTSAPSDPDQCRISLGNAPEP